MTSPDPSEFRIGDAERDEAIEALQEHHTLGRLDASEFDDRMGRALEARTSGDLVQLFTDLPDPRPSSLDGPGPVQSPAPVVPDTHNGELTQPSEHRYTPWYAQWWMILVAVGLTSTTMGRLGFVIPMMAIWLWVIYPSIESNRRRRMQLPPHGTQGVTVNPALTGPDHLTDWQRAKVEDEIRSGRRIQAIKLYRQYTGAGLVEAKNLVDRMARRWEG